MSDALSKDSCGLEISDWLRKVKTRRIDPALRDLEERGVRGGPEAAAIRGIIEDEMRDFTRTLVPRAHRGGVSEADCAGVLIVHLRGTLLYHVNQFKLQGLGDLEQAMQIPALEGAIRHRVSVLWRQADEAHAKQRKKERTVRWLEPLKVFLAPAVGLISIGVTVWLSSRNAPGPETPIPERLRINEVAPADDNQPEAVSAPGETEAKPEDVSNDSKHPVPEIRPPNLPSESPSILPPVHTNQELEPGSDRNTGGGAPRPSAGPTVPGGTREVSTTLREDT